MLQVLDNLAVGHGRIGFQSDSGRTIVVSLLIVDITIKLDDCYRHQKLNHSLHQCHGFVSQV